MEDKDTEDIAGVICVDNKSRVLVVQGIGGMWSFPKGRRKTKETMYQAAVREALEEAGIDLSKRTVNAKINLRYGTYYLYTFKRTFDQIALEKPKTPEEVKDIRWIDTHSQEFHLLEKNADLRCYSKSSSS
jgi:8-oxo-dGTP pyrophosphatase MutT (NUDIX family)